jgi:dTDP-4-amino-4,6-dideoxygalactose transaminase
MTIEYDNLYLTNQKFKEAFQKAFEETFNSGWFILGNRVKEFESSFATYCKSRYCIGVASGLDALFLSLKALELEQGDEVIVPSNTYIATILAVINAGLKPLLVEPDIDTYNINPSKIEAAITPGTKVIMPVHLYGKMADMKAIKTLADRYHLYIVEDCAQAHGARFKDRVAGTFGHLGAYSFYPSKNLGALGDGGGVITGDDTLYNRINRLRNYGSEKKYYNEVIGFNSRLDEVQAAFLQVKLGMLDDIISHKRKLADHYRKNLKKDFIVPSTHPDYFDAYHIFAVRHPQRDKLKEYLGRNGIKTEIHYPVPPYKQKALNGFFDGLSFPIAEEIHATILSLPIAYFHTIDDISQVIETMNKF